MALTRGEVVELLERHGLEPSRALGQNFVADPNTIRRIVRLAEVDASTDVVEIGPGVGSLTTELAATGARVVAVELDRHLLPVLAETVEPLGVRVVPGDALTIDWADVLSAASSWSLVANLPYNVAATIVLHLLDTVPAIDRMLVMVQREVGERLAANAGDAAYGIPSVKLSLWASAEVVARVPATVFIPQPRVESVLVRIVRRTAPVVSVDHDELMALVRTAFGQRRKMLRRSLNGIVDPDDFHAAGISPTARPEELDVQAWGRLASVVRGEILHAPAKLTLSLRITGVRADGYHLIEAVMTSLDLCDELRVRGAHPVSARVEQPLASKVSFIGPYAHGISTDPSNLVSRALAYVGRTATVSVTKNIPHGGGLGGGSSDAAAILRWAGRTTADDVTGSAILGADVPFCLHGGRARVSGVGEIVHPMPFEDQTFTLVVPPLQVSTPAVYKAWDDLASTRSRDTGTIQNNGRDLDTYVNDLEPAALIVEPRLAQWRDRIHAACGIRPTLAGSGATWFVPGRHQNLIEALPEADVHIVCTRPAPEI